ncbi:serine hydrolase [Streptomyces sp. NPDC006458]|uniref:serine hydrolase n=1 Tax=Streptomyces sp. NPDC006458 TaxID=3154302 RepID=UPI00339EA3E4
MQSSPGVRPSRRPLLWILWFLLSVLACAVVIAGAAAGVVRVQAHPRALSSPTGSATGSVVVEGEASVEPVVRPVVDRDALLAEAVGALSVPDGVRLSVAVLDVGSGARAVYGDDSFDTASIVKVDILAALLLQAQDAGRELTSAEKAYAVAMIERSDNDSASALWESVGRASGLAAANARLGLTGTEGGEGMLWGLTQTTAADQLVLLEQVFGGESELSGASQAYVRGLMGRVVEGQRWGVSAVADGAGWALKNGWLPRSATGRWDVNSVGRVVVSGREFLVAVLSDGHAAQGEGVALVEGAAAAAVGVFAEAP